MIGQRLLVKAKLNKGRRQTIELTGRCMDPLLLVGDKARIKATNQYRLGELYLFEMYNGKFALHRLVRKKRTHAVLKGDRTGRYEEVPYEAILGVADSIQLKDRMQWNSLPSNIIYRTYIALISRGNMFDMKMGSKGWFIQKICRRLVIHHGGYWRKKWAEDKA